MRRQDSHSYKLRLQKLEGAAENNRQSRRQSQASPGFEVKWHAFCAYRVPTTTIITIFRLPSKQWYGTLTFGISTGIQEVLWEEIQEIECNLARNVKTIPKRTTRFHTLRKNTLLFLFRKDPQTGTQRRPNPKTQMPFWSAFQFRVYVTEATQRVKRHPDFFRRYAQKLALSLRLSFLRYLGHFGKSERQRKSSSYLQDNKTIIAWTFQMGL